MKKILLTATVQSHIAQFHIPLIDMLKENGYEVHVAARNNLAEKNGLKLDSPDKVYDIPFDRSPFSKNNIKAYKLLKRLVNEQNYDIIHCNTPVGGVVTRLAARKARRRGTRVFYTAHGFHFYEGAPLINWIIYYPIEKWLSHYTDKLITITKEDYVLASKNFSTNVCYIHGVGVNEEKYKPLPGYEITSIREGNRYKTDEILILCIGELNHNKNQKTVIRAFFHVREKISNANLLIAGNGPTEQQLKQLVYELNINDHVRFLGYRTDLDKYINISDIVVSASYREGLPLNIMEAMLCSKPVVASINRGHKELILDTSTGYLISPTDIAGFTEKLTHLCHNKQLRNEMGSRAEKTVQPYKTCNIKRELIDIYEVF